jgi:VIT1/CCC1 family predicted Fe2+/Mn2+ transporter
MTNPLKSRLFRPLPRLLDTNERFSEVLFGLIMVLTFTGSLSVAEAGTTEVKTMLIGAIGCNVAWGLVDASMYLMAAYAEHNKNATAMRAVRESADPAAAHKQIADALPPIVASVMTKDDFESLRKRLTALDPPASPRLGSRDLLGAAAVFCWVLAATFPVLVPFLVVGDARAALRLSNAVAIVMLFAAGYGLARPAGASPWKFGLSLVFIGALLVAITMALGG